MSPEYPEGIKKMIYSAAPKKTDGSTLLGPLPSHTSHKHTRQNDIEYGLLARRASSSTLGCVFHATATTHVIVWIANSLCDCQYTHFISVLAKLMRCVCVAGSCCFNLSAAAFFSAFKNSLLAEFMCVFLFISFLAVSTATGVAYFHEK